MERAKKNEKKNNKNHKTASSYSAREKNHFLQTRSELEERPDF
jgi:hypothetical protein